MHGKTLFNIGPPLLLIGKKAVARKIFGVHGICLGMEHEIFSEAKIMKKDNGFYEERVYW